MDSAIAERIEIAARAIGTVMNSESEVAAVFLFGSFMTDRFNDESDVDIGILFERNPIKIFDDRYMDLKSKLEDAVGGEVDIVVLNSSSPIICMQVLRYGKKIFERGSRTASEFFARTISAYADLKRVRLPIELRVLESRIYG